MMNKEARTFIKFLKDKHIDTDYSDLMDEIWTYCDCHLPGNTVIETKKCGKHKVHVVGWAYSNDYDYMVTNVDGHKCHYGFCI